MIRYTIGRGTGIFMEKGAKNQNGFILLLLAAVLAGLLLATAVAWRISLAKGVFVTRVIDGDTIEIAGGEIVRYIGIDAPETVDPRKPVQCFGREASEENKKLVEGKRVRLEKDISNRDKYGRLLRYVYLGNLFVNDYLVREGYAYAYTYPPDVKYAKEFSQAQKEARENKRGLWNACLPSAGASTTVAPASTTVPAGPAEKEAPSVSDCVDFQEAANYVGENKCVRGRVVRLFTSSKKTTFLDFCQDYKTCPFSVVIFGSDLPNFHNLKQYEGKRVEVSGLVRTYRGRPEIIVSSQNQIKIK